MDKICFSTGLLVRQGLRSVTPRITGVIPGIDVQVREYQKQRRIAGPPRPPHPLKPTPEAFKYRYQEMLPLDGRYTTKPMKIRKLGGRDPETGRVVVRTIGGGNKKLFRWVDFTRHAPEGQTVEEKVYHIRYDPIHTYLIALVANGGHRRWIIASENMKPGDIIKTTNIIPKNPIRVEEGDAWPLGAMSPGTLVHNIEKTVGGNEYFSQYAGAHSVVGRRIGNMIVVKLPSKKEVALDERCMATVGKASNTEFHLRNKLCPQRQRWLGNRPVSGLWHRKDGYCGKKLHPPKPLQFIYSESKKEILGSAIPDIHILDD